MTASETIVALTAALAAERDARQQAEAHAAVSLQPTDLIGGAEAMVADDKLLIAKLRRDMPGLAISMTASASPGR